MRCNERPTIGSSGKPVVVAMQYSFVLPADYDMNIIKQRIASKGHLLDDFPGLIFKTCLIAS